MHPFTAFIPSLLCLPLCLCFAVWLLLPHKLCATHAAAIDMNYTCLGNNQYEVTLNFYYDCNSTENPSSSVEVTLSSNSCNLLLPPVYLFQVFSLSGDDVSLICPSTQSACNNGSLPGIKRYVYRNTIELPESCPDWTIGFQQCCRTPDINNLENPTQYNLYLSARINNTNGLCNNSPTFASLPAPIFCNVASVFDHATFEPDGDQLLFSSIAPQTDYGVSIPYTNGRSASNPLQTSAYNFDATTGRTTFMPNGQQSGIVTHLVEEFRDGVLVGSVMRDMRFLVFDCNNAQIFPLDLAPNNVEVCLGETLFFDLSFSDPDLANALSVQSNMLQVLGNNATLTPNAASQNPLALTLSWTPPPSAVGSYQLIFVATDNACPIPSQTVVQTTIQISQSPMPAAQSLVYCGQPIEMNIEGGSNFTWSPNTGLTLLNPNGSSVVFSPDATTTYTVDNNCGNSTLITVEVISGLSINTTSSSASICPNSAVQLSSGAQGDVFSYQWQPASSFDNPSVANPTVSNVLQSTTYYVTATAANSGCQLSDSVNVTLNGNLRGMDIWTAQDTVCANSSTQLVAALHTFQPCATSSNACAGPSVQFKTGSGTQESDDISPYNGLRTDGRMQMLYTRDYLRAHGINGGTITDLGFDIIQKKSQHPYRNLSIKIGCTDDVLLTAFRDGLTEVYHSNSYETTTGWNTHPLQSFYDWDGTSSLLIEVCFDNNNDDWFFYDAVRCSETLGVSVVSAAANDAVGCSLANGASSKLLPDLLIGFCPTNISVNVANITWTPSIGLDNPQSTSPIASPDVSTNYVATIEQNGCVYSDTIRIVVTESGSIQLNSSATICPNEALQLEVSGANSNAIYQWSPSAGLSCTDCPSPILRPAALGNATQQLSYTVTVSEPNACTATLQTLVQVLPLPTVSVGADVLLRVGESANVLATGSFESIEWSPQENVSDAFSTATLASAERTIELKALVMGQNGCTAADSLLLIYRSCNDITMPSAFSPNDDGVNDTYSIPQQGFDELFRFAIYDRWGRLVFESNDFGKKWDGKYKGMHLPVGVYVYSIELLCDQESSAFRGNFTLVR